MNYYNEIDPFAAEWLENLQAASMISPGIVDTRSIRDVGSEELRTPEIIQAHFFAGIGGWPLALDLAGWPRNFPVWTGSCPCQPFSQAGQGKGFSDDRHLWPEWFRLIRENRPPYVFGEQVASPSGRAWLDLVSSDMEREGYSVGAADLSASGAGAPHKRQRLFFVALSNDERCEELNSHVRQWRQKPHLLEAPGGGSLGPPSPWRRSEWLPCSDGKLRPVEPGTFPVAQGVPGRVGKLRAYGNAIVPQIAALFIRGVIECL